MVKNAAVWDTSWKWTWWVGYRDEGKGGGKDDSGSLVQATRWMVMPLGELGTQKEAPSWQWVQQGIKSFVLDGLNLRCQWDIPVEMWSREMCQCGAPWGGLGAGAHPGDIAAEVVSVQWELTDEGKKVAHTGKEEKRKHRKGRGEKRHHNPFCNTSSLGDSA